MSHQDNINESITTHAPSVVMIDRLGKGGLWTLVLLSVLALVFAVAAFVRVDALRDTFEAKAQSVMRASDMAERETRLQRLEVDEMKVALRMQGYDPDKHLASDKP